MFLSRAGPSCRFSDPFLAVMVGCLSYYVYEGKMGRPQGHHLHELIKKRWDARKQ
ncbi:NCE101-like protein [Saccharomyces kudriavzevii IFO 1802]|uniref:NCE101-like protein n=1 Tax=Saccharomyces kudriavzevii (strain ATCC MYA-4449 / AS 2.2408 / CBS 8840 / NBRC 1802 / NCYC 2889) TaxID=226230 RepID=J6EFD8_SACK1|nr:NCE101-like protein [Saccharomyces kudriavzevii IFO 1802]